MAKRTLLGHTKLKRLCRRLDIPAYAGVGLLECLWHLTVREAPQGDIGKLSDEDIAVAIDWRGNESSLIEALISSGLIDRHDEFRLVVHDWSEHADDAVHMTLSRAVLFFADGKKPKTSRLSGHERDRIEAEYRLLEAHEQGERAHTNGPPCALPSQAIPSHPKPKPSHPKDSSNYNSGSPQAEKKAFLTSSISPEHPPNWMLTRTPLLETALRDPSWSQHHEAIAAELDRRGAVAGGPTPIGEIANRRLRKQAAPKT